MTLVEQAGQATSATGPGAGAKTWDIDALELRVLSRLNSRVRDFRLVLRDGGLVIKGRAFSYYVKQLAQHAVMDVSTLPVVANDIIVE